MPTPEPPENFQIQVTPSDSSPARSVYRRRKTPWWQSPWTIIGGLLMVAVVGGAAWQASRPEPDRVVRFGNSPPMAVDELVVWKYRLPIKLKGVSKKSLRYELMEAPLGVSIDPRSGELTWQPTEAEGPGDYTITVKASSGKLSDKTSCALTVKETDLPPAFADLPPQRSSAGETVQITVTANDPDLPARSVRYSLDQPPEFTARLDQATGEFRWAIPSDQSPGEYRFAIQAAETGGTLSASKVLTVIVAGPLTTSADSVVAALRAQGASASLLKNETRFPQFSGAGRTLLVNGGEVCAFHYPSEAAVQQDASRIQSDGGKFFGNTVAKNSRLHVFRRSGELVVYDGQNERTLAALRSHFGEAIALSPFTSGSSLAGEPENPTGELDSQADPDLKILLSLHKRERLAAAESYPILRKLFADRFARKHESVLKQAWGDDYREMTDWLDRRPEIREEFFLALDPKHDRLPEALRLFHSLRKEFPDRFEEYAQLAIAVSVVWDEPRGSVVDYAHHARRTASNMPQDLLTAPDVFRYFVDAESVMQGRAKFLPWEFLVWMVNDRTPLAERKWALQNYLSRRPQIGKCYKDVPYDVEMLNTHSEVCRLNGKDYVLPNIRQFGGVCAMQADFASRVAKSLGVPAAYVGGESRGGEHHAWVMWVELLSVNQNQIRFSLESYGRYRGDKYYVGTLRDAQTGERTTDREMERELRVLGINPKGKRHADLAIRALDVVDRSEPLSLKDSMAAFLTILKLCPGHEPSWRKLAELAGSEEIDRDERRMMVRALDSLFKTFAGFPDFTWKVFADITRYEKDPRAKVQLYERLLKLYQSAGRPDLACEAALATADLLVEYKRAGDAIQQLSGIILRFADEGRYVPRMLDRMEEIHKMLGGSGADVVAFYQKLLPKIPPKRDDLPSPYAIKMYQRAIECFKDNNRPDLAGIMSAKLTALQAGM